MPEESRHGTGSKEIGLHGMLDRIDNPAIAGTATQIAAEPIPDRLVIWVGLMREQRNNGQDHAGGAKAALKTRPVARKRRLDTIFKHARAAAKSFDRSD